MRPKVDLCTTIGAVSLVVISLCVTIVTGDETCRPLRGLDLTGAVLMLTKAADPSGCCDNCTRMSGCDAASFNHVSSQCTLWSNITSSRRADSVTSFVKGPVHLQELAMQLFVSTFNCSDSSWTAATPVCNWNGVSCNSSGFVESFRFDDRGCGGAVHLSLLPRTLQYLFLRNNSFTGELDFGGLPSLVQFLDVSSNQFSGQLDLAALGSQMQYVYLNDNRFSGSVDLTTTCATKFWMQLLLHNNRLSGPVNFTGLANCTLNKLTLNNNQFSGIIDLGYDSCAGGVLYLTLNNNRFSGTPKFGCLSPEMYLLDLSNNDLCGSTIVPEVDDTTVACPSFLEIPTDCNCTVYGDAPNFWGELTCPAC